MRRPVVVIAALALLELSISSASALEVSTPTRRLPGRVRSLRVRDLNGDGRADVVAVVDRREPDRLPETEVVVLLSPADPAADTFFRDTDVVRIPCSGEAAGPRARAGAVAIGRFGAAGALRLRFLGPVETPDLEPDGRPAATSAPPCLLERSPGEPLASWDAVGDADGDGRDECFVPGPDGALVIAGVTIPASEQAMRSEEDLCVRVSRSPRPTLADVDGDGRAEILRVDGAALVVERTAAGPDSPARTERVPLSFLVPDPARPPEQLRSPRISIADVNGDGRADLLVTLVHGRADKLGGLRTSLYCFPGPFYAAGTFALREPVSRLDTESVALHPRFVDVDGDGDLDYVADSIRGSMIDLIKRVTGAEPAITFTVFRFDKTANAFEKEPLCAVERPYSGPEARSNSFGRSGFFEGDFDGDGLKDLLDLGNLTKVVVLKGTRDARTFQSALVEGPAAGAGATYAPDALVGDLNGDGLTDAVVYVDDRLQLLVSRGGKR